MTEGSQGESRNESQDKDWKLKLRNGRLVTPYKHFSAIADGIAGNLPARFTCRPGRAVMAMSMWATDPEQSLRMIREVGERLGFTMEGKVEVYETEPQEPPGPHPSGYGIFFLPHDGD